MAKHILLKESFNGNRNIVEVGLDEAGRGALSGPVTIAACIMPAGFQHELVKDSKLLNEGDRAEACQIVLNNAIAYSIQHIYVDEIESTNILRATLMGMHKCLVDLYENKHNFDFILIDGDQFHGYNGIPFETIIGGDNKYISIAAASILAKTARDNYMREISKSHPEYGWGSNKGYGSAQHRNAIAEFGATDHHRHSFISHMLTTTPSLF
jgi:ribonuclease HII